MAFLNIILYVAIFENILLKINHINFNGVFRLYFVCISLYFVIFRLIFEELFVMMHSVVSQIYFQQKIYFSEHLAK